MDPFIREAETHLGGNVHTVYRGLKSIGGALTDQEAVVFVVGHKMDAQAMGRHHEHPLPVEIVIDGRTVRTDVVEAPQPTDLRKHFIPGIIAPYASLPQQACYPCPIPGGVQIAPAGANWVGTLGAAVQFQDDAGKWRFGGLSNWHVLHGGKGKVGTPIHQPTGQRGPIGALARWGAMRFGVDGFHTVDAAIFDCRVSGGRFGAGVDTVKPSQLTLGALQPTPVEATLRMKIRKEGRTTGVKTGTVIGLNGSSIVNYGELGSLQFREQIVIQGDGGEFSAPGDSGSLIVTKDANQPVALLFAGGGNQTLGNRIQHVLSLLKCRFYAA